MPLREWFEETLPNLKPVTEQWKALGPPTILPDGERPPWGPLGTAIDYRVRYFFACTPPSEFVAAYSLLVADESDALGVLAGAPARAQGLDSYGRLAAALDDHVAQHPPMGRVLDPAAEERLARFCHVLALYEIGFRTGLPVQALVELGAGADAERQLAIVEEAWVADLVALAHGCLRALEPVLAEPTNLNPTFSGSHLVGGADADLIVGRTLLEVKTTKALRPDRDWVYQLVGYVLLDDEDAFGIEQIGFLLGRVGGLLTWDFDELVETLAGRPVSRDELRAGFRVAAAEGVAAERAGFSRP